MKSVNNRLCSRVNLHEEKLFNITDELNKTWTYVSTLKHQHRQLHTSEQVILSLTKLKMIYFPQQQCPLSNVFWVSFVHRRSTFQGFFDIFRFWEPSLQRNVSFLPSFERSLSTQGRVGTLWRRRPLILRGSGELWGMNSPLGGDVLPLAVALQVHISLLIIEKTKWFKNLPLLWQ